jgi:hypothetical protein
MAHDHNEPDDPEDRMPATLSFPNGPPRVEHYLERPNWERAMRNYEAELVACARLAAGDRPSDVYAAKVDDPGAPDGAGPSPLPVAVLNARIGEIRYRVVLEINMVPRLERGDRDILGGDSWSRVDRGGERYTAEILAEAVTRTLEVLDNRRTDGYILGGPRDTIDGPKGQRLITIDLGKVGDED